MPITCQWIVPIYENISVIITCGHLVKFIKPQNGIPKEFCTFDKKKNEKCY